MVSNESITSLFTQIRKENPQMSLSVVAVKALTESVESQTSASTISELIETLTQASNTLKGIAPRNFSIVAGCESFLKFLSTKEVQDFAEYKQSVIESGKRFLEKAPEFREKVAAYGVNLIKDDTILLVHSYSRVVMKLLHRATSLNRRFRVFVTESRPSNNGRQAADELRSMGIPVATIPDSAVGFIIDQVDMVLVGAEGVVENGGLINQIGTYQIAVVAKAANKPFYSVTESYKFVRIYPLGQADFCPTKIEFSTAPGAPGPFELPSMVDYTPPHLVSSLITNLGVLTPSGVVLEVFAKEGDFVKI